MSDLYPARFPCHKPNAREIVLLGSGLSLDLAHPSEYEWSDDRLVVGLNGASAIADCDYVVLTDTIALNQYPPNALRRYNQYCVAPKSSARQRAESMFPGVDWLVVTDTFGVDNVRNARMLALHLVARLCDDYDIERVVYIGMDSGCLEERHKGIVRTWQYASIIRDVALDSVQADRCYAGHRSNRHSFRVASGLENYRSYLPAVVSLFTNHSRRAPLLECRSFMDWSKLSGRGDPSRAFVPLLSRNPDVESFNWGAHTRVEMRDGVAMAQMGPGRADPLTPQPTPRTVTIYGHDLRKCDAREIYVLGSGCSLDCYELASIPESAIVITTNAALAVAPFADIQVIGDSIATEWKDHHPGCLWMARAKCLTPLRKAGVPRAIIDDHIDREWSGSGAEALTIAYDLAEYRLPSIERITIIGLDYCSVIARQSPRFHYRYASRLRPHLLNKLGEIQSTIPNMQFWRRDDLTTVYTTYRGYNRQAKSVVKLFRDDSFREKCVSHSLIDHTRMKLGLADCNFRQARREPFNLGGPDISAEARQ